MKKQETRWGLPRHNNYPDGRDTGGKAFDAVKVKNLYKVMDEWILSDAPYSVVTIETQLQSGDESDNTRPTVRPSSQKELGMAEVPDEKLRLFNMIQVLVMELKENGVSVIVISHNIQHVFSIADKIVVLRHGKFVGKESKNKQTVMK